MDDEGVSFDPTFLIAALVHVAGGHVEVPRNLIEGQELSGKYIFLEELIERDSISLRLVDEDEL